MGMGAGKEKLEEIGLWLFGCSCDLLPLGSVYLSAGKAAGLSEGADDGS